MDTAGLRVSHDEIENMGIALTQQTLRRADLILLLLDAKQGMTLQDKAIIKDLPEGIPQLLVLNKSDLVQGEFPDLQGMEKSVRVSAKTGEGIEELRDKLLEAVGWRDQEGGVFIARERHLRSLTQAQTHLNRARTVLTQAELFAEELRLAQRALNEITGEFTPDDLLGEIFSRFCIGK
jgi:tRNA modification GTPase